MHEDTEQAAEDTIDTIRLLGTFYVVLGCIGAVAALFPLLHLILGIGLLNGTFPSTDPDPDTPAIPQAFAIIFVVLPALFIVLGEALAILMILCGRRMRQLRAHRFCFIVSCISLAAFPLGTLLGIFSVMLLNKRSTRQLFLS